MALYVVQLFGRRKKRKWNQKNAQNIAVVFVWSRRRQIPLRFENMPRMKNKISTTTAAAAAEATITRIMNLIQYTYSHSVRETGESESSDSGNHYVYVCIMCMEITLWTFFPIGWIALNIKVKAKLNISNQWICYVCVHCVWCGIVCSLFRKCLFCGIIFVQGFISVFFLSLTHSVFCCFALFCFALSVFRNI